MRNRIKNILTAILLLALSASLILWKLDVFALPEAFGQIAIWQLIIAIIMVVVIFHSIIDINYVGIFFPLAILAIIFDKPLGITAITPWIVLIVALLLTIAFEKLLPSHWIKRHFKSNVKEFKQGFKDGFKDDGPTINVDFSENGGNSDFNDDNEYIYHSIKMGSGTKYITSRNLKTADLSSEFGELSAYFERAQVPGGEVTIHTKVAFGEMNLYIPREWNVNNKVAVSMGDCTDNASSIPGEEGGVKCVINGSVNFGDLNIIKV